MIFAFIFCLKNSTEKQIKQTIIHYFAHVIVCSL